ncbi:hypothetical protein MKZ38_004445 [Zalerion maritima]|uniref:Uncharacterized protein n=1 Tax=Zalerion maritima TaxID=339359 RepID=A0AAD5RWH3_9PEZI|nr:hypothetical protein MKZ38_004445 [Zalerion maritima]
MYGIASHHPSPPERGARITPRPSGKPAQLRRGRGACGVSSAPENCDQAGRQAGEDDDDDESGETEDDPDDVARGEVYVAAVVVAAARGDEAAASAPGSEVWFSFLTLLNWD